MTVPDTDLDAVIARLVVPTAAELFEARELVLDELHGGDTRHEQDLTSAFERRNGLPEPTSGEQVVQVQGSDGHCPAPTADELPLRRERLRRAVRESLARLIREDVVVPVGGDSYGEASGSVMVHQVQGGSSSTGRRSFPDRTALLRPGSGCRWRLADDARSPRQMLARTDLGRGLDDLLGPRGMEVL